MENKSLIQALVAMLVVLILWSVVVSWYHRQYPPPTAQPGQVEPPPGQTPPAPQGLAAEQEPGTTEPASASAPSTIPASHLVAVGADQPADAAWIGEAGTYRSGPFRLEIQGDSLGGSLRQALLTDYLAQVTAPKDFDKAPHLQLFHPAAGLASSDEFLSLATPSITILQGDERQKVDLGRVPWRTSVSRDSSQQHSIRYDVEVQREGAPLLDIEKEFVLPAESIDSGRHDLFLSVRVKNVSDATVQFTMEQDGPTGMPKEAKRMDERSVYAATVGETGLEVQRKRLRDIRKAPAVDLGGGGAGMPLAWVALSNKFFTVLMAPAFDEGDAFGDLFARVEAFARLDGDDPDASSGLAFRFVTSQQTLPPGGEVVFKFACYLGPKARSSLTGNEEYQRRSYISILEKGYSRGCSFCTFAILAKLMVVMLNFFHGVLFDNYGLAIIVLVLIVRVVLHPVTRKGQVNMVKMQEKMGAMQPKMDELKKKYANDKAKLNQATMELYKESGMSPVGQVFTCLPMFLQMPIWIALWTSLNYTVEMRHEPFCLWIRDLTGPDALNLWFGWHFEPFSIPLLSGMIGQVDSFNLLPIILSVTMYMQQRFMPKAATAHKRSQRNPDQMAQQQKMMNVMMVFFGVLFYNAPSGLCLYILSSNIFGMIEQWRIRKHIAEEKAAGKLAPPPTKPKESRKPGFLKKLEKLADEAKQVRSQRDRKR